MAAGDVVACNEVARKVEIEDTSDVNEVGAVATVDCNVNVGRNGEDDSNDSSHVVVSGIIEVSADDIDDIEGVNVDDVFPKSDLTGEANQYKEEELGVEYKGVPVEPLVLGTTGMVHESITTVSDVLAEGSAVDPPVVLTTSAIAHDASGHLNMISGPTMETIECSQVTVSELESAIQLSDVTGTQSLSMPDIVNSTDESLSTPFTVSSPDYKIVNDDPESISSLIDRAECLVTVPGSGKTSEDLEFQVRADASESLGSPIQEQEGQSTVDGSGKLSEDFGSQVTVDHPKSCGNPNKEAEGEVSVNGSDSAASSVDDSEPSANEKKESDTIGMELDGSSEECKELLVITSEVIKAENKNSEGTSGIESEVNPDSGLVLSEEVDALANEQVVKFDRILEIGEAQILGTETDRSSEKLLNVAESVEMEVNTKEMEQVKVEDEIQESQRVAVDNVLGELKLEDSTTESANDTEVSSEIETNNETLTHENASSQYGVSNCIDKPQEGLQPEASAKYDESTNTVELECNNSKFQVGKDDDSLSNPDDLTVVEQKIEIVSNLDKENRSAEVLDCGTVTENVDVSDDDDEKETGIEEIEDVSHLVTEIKSAEGIDCATGVEDIGSDGEEKGAEVKIADVELVHHIVPENRSPEDMNCETGGENVNLPDTEKVSEVNDSAVRNHSTLTFSDTIVNRGAVIEFGSIGRHETTPSIQTDEIPNSSVHGEVNDATDVQNEEVEVLEYNFLVKIPRSEDETIRDQIRSAQVLVNSKTRLRDSIRAEIHGKRARLRAYNEEYNAAKTEEIAARRLVRSKRQEIESVQAVIDRWKNAMSVEDIDAKIFNVEYMIQHETLLLRDEKQFIREIKQLKSLRDQLALNMGSPEEVRQAIDLKDHNEERLKTLRKELDSLKLKVSKAEAVLKTIGEQYEQESRKEIELQAQFRAADDVRQKAYAHLNSLKKLSYDENQNFRKFKDDLTKARKFASDKNKDALHHLCANQVETFMEQWNSNDEFRKAYVNRLNMIAIRRQKALDGSPSVPDDVAPVLPGNVNEGVDRSPVSIPVEVKHVSVVLPVEQGKDVSSSENKNADSKYTSKSIENVSGQKNQELKNRGVAKATNSGSDDMAKEEAELAGSLPTKEEIELARKAEELRKEEIAAKLKEQRRLEEKAKAIEALERKKRNAEKALLRSELRARKEAEQKEKEREKRLRKKENKKTGGGDRGISGEEAASSESSNEATTKETETVTKKKTQKPPAHFFSKQLKPKPVPPPLINRNKKRWQQYGNYALVFLAVLFVFLLINFGLLSDFDFKSANFKNPF